MGIKKIFLCSRHRKGFALIGALVALLILMIALFSLAGVVISTTMLLSHSFDRETAASMAAEKLDELETNYDAIASGGSSMGKFILAWSVTEATDVKTVEMTVNWNGVLGERVISMEREYAKLQ